MAAFVNLDVRAVDSKQKLSMDTAAVVPPSGCSTLPASYIEPFVPTSRDYTAFQPIFDRTSDPCFFPETAGGFFVPQEIGSDLSEERHQHSFAFGPSNGQSSSSTAKPTTEIRREHTHRTRAKKRLQMRILEKVNGSRISRDLPEQKKQGLGPNVDPTEDRHHRPVQYKRNAAARYRVRKQDEASVLVSREQALEDQCRYLSACVDALTHEIYHLKAQILQHSECSCVLIQRYIAYEAAKTIDALPSLSSEFQFDIRSTSPNFRSQSNSGISPTVSLGVPIPEFEATSATWF